LRGRKFYFHHDPTTTVSWYHEHWAIKKPATEGSEPAGAKAKGHMALHLHPVEALERDAESDPVDIRFDDLPERLLKLLLVVLSPGCGVKHKVGGLRALGFGSAEFVVESVLFDPEGIDRLRKARTPHTDPLIEDWRNRLGTNELETSKDMGGLVHTQAWQWLRFVLAWPGTEAVKTAYYRYPGYLQKEDATPVVRGFAKPVAWNPDWAAQTPADVLAKVFPRLRVPIEFDAYQMNAANYEERRRQAGLDKEGWDHKHPTNPITVDQLRRQKVPR
jgi:hypothetical protein